MKRLSIVVALLGLPAAAQAETWRVLDGAARGMANIWQVERSGDALTGRAAEVRRDGKTTPIALTGTVVNGEYQLQSRGTEGVPGCTFSGKASGDKDILGAAICGGQTRIWRVERM